MRTEEKTLTT